MQTFCTIVTSSHLPYAKTLYSSLQRFNAGINLQVLVTDSAEKKAEGNFILHNPESIASYSLSQEIEKKYAHTNSDHFRWALKPVFISYLLEQGFDKVVYCDPDIFFTSSYDYIFNELETASVLLSPHWRNRDPVINEENFFALFKDGLYNAGLIAASKKGLAAMQWWAGACHFKMEKRNEQGLYDDQRYLDALPILFDNVKPLTHQGYNIAHWNMDECKRSVVNGEIVINNKYPVVCIHFTAETIHEIETGKDGLLKPYLEDYKKECLAKSITILDKPPHNLFTDLKRKTLLRTRLKKWLYRLAEKI